MDSTNRNQQKTPPAPLEFNLQMNSQGVITYCDFADVLLGVEQMLADEDEFVVLEPRTVVNGVRFLQSAQYPKGIVVEFSIQTGDGWQMLRKIFSDGEPVKQIFLDFFQTGRLPDLTQFWEVPPGDDYSECC